MVTAPKKSDKSKKKGTKAPKAPVGRPRKKLGTRVTDVPLVSTLRPRAARSNADSAALQRARLQFKRDYPVTKAKEETFDEYKTRALLDAMADPSRGPIGSRVLGPAEYKVQQRNAKLAAAVAANQPVIVQDGRLLLNKNVARALLSTAAPAAAPVPVGPSLALIPSKVSTGTNTGREITATPTVSSKSGRQASVKIKIKKEPPTVSEINKKFDDALEKVARIYEIEKTRREAGDLEGAEKERQRARRREEAARKVMKRELKERKEWEASQAAAPAAEAGPSGLTQEERDLVEQVSSSITPAQEAQATRIVKKFTKEQLTAAAARMKAAEGIKAVKAASPVVAQEVQRQMDYLTDVDRDPPIGLSGFDEMVDLSNQERRRQLDAEEEREYGPFRPTTDQAEELEALAALAAQADDSTPTRQQRVANAYNERLKRMRANRDLVMRDASSTLQAAVRSALAQNALNVAVRQREDMDRRAIADQAAQEEAELANLGNVRRDASSTLQAAVRSALVRDAIENANAKQEAASSIQAAVRSALTRDAMRQARDRIARDANTEMMTNELQSNAARVIQRAIRDKASGVAKQKRIISKVLDEYVPPRPRSGPAMSQPSIRYDDIIDEVDLNDVLGREEDAARQLQAALRRFGDNRRFATAREIEAEWARNEIGVPGADIRPNYSTIPIPPPPKRPSRAKSEEDKLLGRVLRKPIEQAAKAVAAAELQSTAARLKPPTAREKTAVKEAIAETLADTIKAAVSKRRGAFDGEDDDSSDWEEPLAEFVTQEQAGTSSGTTGRLGDEIRAIQASADAGYIDPEEAETIKFAILQKEKLADSGVLKAAGLKGGKIDFNKIMKVIGRERAKYEKARRGAGMCGGNRRDWQIIADGLAERRMQGYGNPMILSRPPTPTGGSEWVLQAVTFPDTDWKTSSSLRWLRSNGIKPIKKADKQGTLFRYRIVDPKGFNEYYTSDLMSRGRKIHLVYGK